MTRTALDVAMAGALALASGGAGWWLHAAVDEWRTRRMLARIDRGEAHLDRP